MKSLHFLQYSSQCFQKWIRIWSLPWKRAKIHDISNHFMKNQDIGYQEVSWQRFDIRVHVWIHWKLWYEFIHEFMKTYDLCFNINIKHCFWVLFVPKPWILPWIQIHEFIKIQFINIFITEIWVMILLNSLKEFILHITQLNSISFMNSDLILWIHVPEFIWIHTYEHMYMNSHTHEFIWSFHIWIHVMISYVKSYVYEYMNSYTWNHIDHEFILLYIWTWNYIHYESIWSFPIYSY